MYLLLAPVSWLQQYQLALFQIDSLRKDGKFIGVDGSIPEGQGIVMAHLSECHELVSMLKESMDEEQEEYYEEDEDPHDDTREDSGDGGVSS
jgi:hypothetical protein